MNWEIASDVASVVESLFVVVSVILIVVQLRKQTELARAANSQATFELSSPFNLELIRDRDFVRLWLQGPDSSDPIDCYRHESLVTWWLLLHENIFYQRKKGLLDEEAFLPWKQDLSNFVERAKLSEAWPKLRASYQEGFAAHVDQILKTVPGSSAKLAPNPGPQADV